MVMRPMTTPFDLLPAIDLRGGGVVRLQQGDFDRETVFASDPVAVARSFADAGARWLHVVDLDGARTGVPAHADVITAIVAGLGDDVAVEVAGGLRSEAAVTTMLDIDVARVVVGTFALRDPASVRRLVERHGGTRIAVAIDVRAGEAVGEGWVAGASGVDAVVAIRRLADAGVRTFEVTAIDRDGGLEGPDLGLYRRLVDLGLGDVIASGGIRDVADLRAVREIGCVGAIVGRALYDGSLPLDQALAG
jgi:phosphoribosylformimino-5-aminoimidazole carboxamide ribotide isomerase